MVKLKTKRWKIYTQNIIIVTNEIDAKTKKKKKILWINQESILVFHCHVTNCHKLRLKQNKTKTPIYYLIVSMDQKSGTAWLGSVFRVS